MVGSISLALGKRETCYGCTCEPRRRRVTIIAVMITATWHECSLLDGVREASPLGEAAEQVRTFTRIGGEWCVV